MISQIYQENDEQQKWQSVWLQKKVKQKVTSALTKEWLMFTVYDDNNYINNYLLSTFQTVVWAVQHSKMCLKNTDTIFAFTRIYTNFCFTNNEEKRCGILGFLHLNA